MELSASAQSIVDGDKDMFILSVPAYITCNPIKNNIVNTFFIIILFYSLGLENGS